MGLKGRPKEVPPPHYYIQSNIEDTLKHSKLVLGIFFLINFTNEIFSLKALSFH